MTRRASPPSPSPEPPRRARPRTPPGPRPNRGAGAATPPGGDQPPPGGGIEAPRGAQPAPGPVSAPPPDPPGDPAPGPSSTIGVLAPDLRPLAVPLASLQPHPDNARRHTLERDIPVLMESLRRYGQRKPIVAKREFRGLTNVVVAGNGTLQAAERLEWTHLAVSWFDGSDDEADEYALVDNRTAELSEWDLETLARQMRTIRDRSGAEALERMGWAAHESAPLLAAEWRPPTEGHLPGREVAWRSVSLSLGQWLVLELAVQRVQERERDPAMPEGRCVELLAAEFLSGPGPDGQ